MTQYQTSSPNYQINSEFHNGYHNCSGSWVSIKVTFSQDLTIEEKEKLIDDIKRIIGS